MPKFRTQVAQDACIMWYADIEADSKEDAAKQAMDAWNGRRDDIEFREGDPVGYDDANCDPEDCELIEGENAYREIFGETVLERATRETRERTAQLAASHAALSTTPEASRDNAKERAYARLIDEYAAWNKANNLSLGSADEHCFDEALTHDQRVWLQTFVRRWDAVGGVQ